jgi:DNA-binding transcriptional ArsR family regulator
VAEPARKHTPGDEAEEEAMARPVKRPKKRANRSSPVDLDRVIHERVRLGIVSALAVSESLSFNELKAALDTTDGNLSVHARRLEEAGYVTCDKSFEGRVPRTEFSLTPAGRKALQHYLEHMEALIQRVREQ